MADGAGSQDLQELLEAEGPLTSTNQGMSVQQAAVHVEQGQRLVPPGGVTVLNPDEPPESCAASPLSNCSSVQNTMPDMQHTIWTTGRRHSR